jgi:mannose-6-phosphate isomerase-like protein (cupin superfamily)
MTGEPEIDHIRNIDSAALDAAAGRFTQMLLGRDSGGTTCEINCIKTPVGDGSPAGLHTHPFEQIFYVLEGTMSIEIDGREHQAGPGTLVINPAGVPHRNWNAGTEPTVHLALNVPLPDPNVPFATTVEP